MMGRALFIKAIEKRQGLMVACSRGNRLPASGTTRRAGGEDDLQ